MLIFSMKKNVLYKLVETSMYLSFLIFDFFFFLNTLQTLKYRVL